MFHAPRPAGLPHLSSIVDNIGQPADKLAHYLDLSPSTMRRYIADGQAPRPVMLSLFWETTWGLGAADCVAINQSRMLYSENLILKRKLAANEKQIELLERALDSRAMASNSPIFKTS